MIQKPREANAGLEVCISAFQFSSFCILRCLIVPARFADWP
jgi:hypothetical protein